MPNALRTLEVGSRLTSENAYANSNVVDLDMNEAENDEWLQSYNNDSFMYCLCFRFYSLTFADDAHDQIPNKLNKKALERRASLAGAPLIS